MNIVKFENNVVIMSSRDIADMTGKRHDHILRDIDKLVADLSPNLGAGYKSTTYEDANGVPRRMYEMDKEATLCLVAGYDVSVRMKIIKRWQELEQGSKPKLPQTFSEALRLAAEQAEMIEEQERQLALAAPKVAFVDEYVDASGLKSFRQVAKLLEAKEHELRKFLVDDKIMYKLNGEWVAHSPHLEAGRFKPKTGKGKNEHAYLSHMFTAKGVEYVAGKWATYKLNKEENT